MPQFILENFASQVSDVPINPERQPFYQLAGIYSDYANKTGTVLEEQFASMAAAPAFLTASGSLSGNVTYMIPSTYPGYSAFACTSNMNIYSVGSNYSLGQPTGFSASAGGRLEVYNGNILASESGLVSRMDLSTRATWNSIAGAGFTSLCPLKAFLASCFVAGIGGGSLELNQINPDWSVTAGVLTIGAGWVPIAMENYNNKLLAIAASFSTATVGISPNFGSSYIFLWDGSSKSYNYSVKVPGLFIDFCSPDGNLYVLHQTATNYYTVSVLTTGFVLKEIASFSYNITTCYKLVPFDSGELAVMTSAGVLIIDPDDKSSFFLDNIANNNTYTYIMGASGGPNNYLYVAGMSTGGATTTINYFPYLVGSNGYQQVSFNTHFMPAKTPTGQGTVQTVEVWYDTPPISGIDDITLTLNGDWSADPNAPAGARANSFASLPNITPSNAGAKYVSMDGQGMTFNKLRLNGTANSSSGWFPNIRKIIINYN